MKKRRYLLFRINAHFRQIPFVKVLFLAVLMLLIYNYNSVAANIIWNNGNATNNWNDGLNWSTGAVPGSGDIALFNGTSTANCNLNGSPDVAGIDVQAAYSGTITQNAGITITVGASNFSMAAGTFTGGNSSITINGTFSLSGGNFTSTSGVLTFVGSYTKSGGTFTQNNGTVVFAATSGAATLTGSTAFYNLTFTATAANQVYTIAAGTVLTCTNTLSWTGTKGVTVNTGTIDAQGDITDSNSFTDNNNLIGGNATININGIIDQTLTGQGSIYRGALCSININKATGTLFLVSLIGVTGNWTYTQGTINYGASTIVFSASSTITGSHQLNNLTFSQTNGGVGRNYIYTIAAGTTLTVNSTLNIGDPTFGAPNSMYINTGTIDAKGNVAVYSYATTGNSGGSATIHICGTGNQNLTGQNFFFPNQGYGPLCKINIDKASGTLSLVGYIVTCSSWTYTQGTVDPGISTVMFMYSSTGPMTITGSLSLYNVTFNGSGSMFFNIATGTTITVTNTLVLSGGGGVYINTGSINAIGDINVSQSSGFGSQGTATINICGTGNQTFFGATFEGLGGTPNITINKPSGTLTLKDIINVGDNGSTTNWTYIAGTVDASTNTSKINIAASTANVTCTNGSANMSFYDLKLSNIWGTIVAATLTGDVRVSNVLSLTKGNINLNSHTLYLTNNSTGACTRTTGYIKSETTDNASKINWNVGGTTGSYIYPFATATGTYIPLTFQLTAGTAGNVAVSTYPTASNNTPYPTAPDNVTNLLKSGADNSTNAIDRFWQIDKSGPSGTATISYTYNQAEVTGGVAGNEGLLQAQRYNTSNNLWDAALPGQTADGTTNVVTEPGITQFSPRTLALSSSPLPIELLSFTARKNDDRVDLVWVTATEANNDYFTIERSANNLHFEQLATIKGAGNSTAVKEYLAEDKQPLSGVSYYKLKQTDFDGKYKYSPTVAVQISKDFIEQLFPNPTTGTFMLRLNEKKEKTILVVVLDIIGTEIYSSSVIIENGSDKVIIKPEIDIPTGIYYVVASSDDKLVKHKLVIAK
ncbi:MAG: T9SS type A sorting domain-containing protein [Bacteroidetes bacterium]|nr:T9SS type A sorting domain-containing protein [Bacteroidota bacterium]